MMKGEPVMTVAGFVSLDITPGFPPGKTRQLSELLKPGKLIHVVNTEVACGGCVSNTGLALHKFGADVQLYSMIGDDDFGRILQERYRKLGVKSHFKITDRAATSFTLAIAPPGCDRIFLTDNGANDIFTADDVDAETVENTQFFHYGYPTLMREFNRNAGTETVKLMKRAYEADDITSFDLAMCDPESPAGHEDLAKLLHDSLPYVDFFTPSFEELCFMLDREKYGELLKRSGDEDICLHLSLERDVRPLAQKALALGCGVILLKCGVAGIYLAGASPERVGKIEERMKKKAAARNLPFCGFQADEWAGLDLFQRSYTPDRIISGTGAGDTAIAAFLRCMSLGEKPERCLQAAAGTGACNVTEKDSQSGLMMLDDLFRRIDAGWQTQDLINE